MWVKPKSKQETIISSGVIKRIKHGREGKTVNLSTAKFRQIVHHHRSQRKNQLNYSGSHLTHYWSFLSVNCFYSIASMVMQI